MGGYRCIKGNTPLIFPIAASVQLSDRPFFFLLRAEKNTASQMIRNTPPNIINTASNAGFI
jgi:hypothetical protein